MIQFPSRIVVTGGGGFIGSHVAEHFARRGSSVTVVDNLSRSVLLGTNHDTTFNWGYLGGVDNIKRIKADIVNSTGLKKSIEGAEAIVHTAAQTAVTSSLTDPVMDMRVNLMGTKNVLEAARLAKSSPTLVFCSTNKVYGDNVNQLPIEEGADSYSLRGDVQGISEEF